MANEPATNFSKRLKWRVEWLAQTGFEKLAGLLPGPLVFRVGEALGGVAWHCMRSRRQIVLRNLRIAFCGEHGLPELREMARQSFRRTGANLFSALHVAGLPAAEVARIFSIENPELIDDALTRGPGVVTLPPHMGNWELLTRIKPTFPEGIKAGAFYRPLNNPLVDARVLAQREMVGTRLFSKRDSFHLVTGFLREGAVVGILADQRVGKQGELVNFFGRLTRASPLPSLIARRAKCGVLGMSVITETPGKWRVRYHKLGGPISTTTCNEAIERSMRASPVDVFWLQERWKVFISPKRPIRDWLGEDSIRSEKPHRALLWLAGAPDGWEIPHAWTHPDVIYEIALTADQAKPSWPGSGEIVHTVPTEPTRKLLAAIDSAAALPIDYILTYDAPAALRRAAELESIPVVSLASAGRKMSESPPPEEEES